MCPQIYVDTATGGDFTELQGSNASVTIQVNGRVNMQRSVHYSGGMVEERELSFSVSNPAKTALLRSRNLRWWVVRLTKHDGSTLLFADKEFPARIELSGTDTSETVTLNMARYIE